MSYEDIVANISNETGVSRANVKEVIDTLGAEIVKSLNESGRARIPALGVFEKRMRSARTGRNPQTGETMQIPAREAVGFKVGSKLKNAV